MLHADPMSCLAPAWQQAAAVKAKAVRPRELVLEYARRVERFNGQVNAYVATCVDAAVERADQVENAIRRGDDPGPLAGVPVALKDLFDLHSAMPHTYGSVPLAEHVPPRTADHVRRLESAGAIVLGKTNVPEFGHQGVTDNKLFGPTSTPFHLGMNAGGSSGGSAAAVASGIAGLALGSDGGGSVRIPAAFCGVVGFKPTFGHLPQTVRPNAFTVASPFVQQGTLTRTVNDAALLLEVLMRPSTRDPWSAAGPAHGLREACARPAPKGRVAYSVDFGTFPVEPAVTAVVAASVEHLGELGLHVEAVAGPLTTSHEVLATAWRQLTAVANAERLDRLAAEGFDLLRDDGADLTPTYADLLAEGQRLNAVDYARIGRLRTNVFDELEALLETYDFVVTPTLAVPFVANADRGVTTGPAQVAGQRVDPLIGWCLTYPVNFTGHPAASVPAGRGLAGVPVGLQVVGRRGEDRRVLELCAAVEEASPWHTWYGELEAALDTAAVRSTSQVASDADEVSCGQSPHRAGTEKH